VAALTAHFEDIDHDVLGELGEQSSSSSISAA